MLVGPRSPWMTSRCSKYPKTAMTPPIISRTVFINQYFWRMHTHSGAVPLAGTLVSCRIWGRGDFGSWICGDIWWFRDGSAISILWLRSNCRTLLLDVAVEILLRVKRYPSERILLISVFVNRMYLLDCHKFRRYCHCELWPLLHRIYTYRPLFFSVYWGPSIMRVYSLNERTVYEGSIIYAAVAAASSSFPLPGTVRKDTAFVWECGSIYFYTPRNRSWSKRGCVLCIVTGRSETLSHLIWGLSDHDRPNLWDCMSLITFCLIIWSWFISLFCCLWILHWIVSLFGCLSMTRNTGL